ncbi:MAG: RNA-binding S4 domain-containing protein [Firmicutes bacterium]|nr:RNA-binding S4 domain-containing protein [Bacillota bacterium]
MKEIKINTESIQLDQFLKWANIAYSGGEAKQMIQAGVVLVNGQKEMRRSHKIVPGDRVTVETDEFVVVGSVD